jgi:Sec-independent protein translocase protein TatA
VGFGMEILFVLMLGLVVLGPKRLQTMLAHVVRAKAELENATLGIKSQLSEELEAASKVGKTDCSRAPDGTGPFDHRPNRRQTSVWNRTKTSAFTGD